MTENIELLADNQISFKSLVQLCPDMKNSVKWLQQNNILSSTRICSQGHEMNLQLSEKNSRWRCRKKDCTEAYGLRKGTFLENTRLPFDDIIFFHLFRGL